MKKVVASIAMTFAAGSAFANSACDNPQDNFDYMYCLNKVYMQADADLNANYKKLVPKLDHDGVATLKKRQLAWIKERNDMCSEHEKTRFMVDLDCVTEKTIERTKFLQDRYRECTSSGCQNSRLQ